MRKALSVPAFASLLAAAVCAGDMEKIPTGILKEPSMKQGESAVVKAIIDVAPEKTYDAQGDLWVSCWADDDCIYSVNGDGSAFGLEYKQVNLSRLSGDKPDALTGVGVRGIGEYGAKFDGSTKTMGLTCIDGVLYAALHAVKNIRQNQAIPVKSELPTHNCSILKSLDHGSTWLPAPDDIKGNYTFPGTTFPAANFINYGKDGTGRPTADQSDKYVYLTSSDMGWSNGDYYMLVRVLKEKLPALNAKDYQFYCGGDGLLDTSWTGDAAKTAHIIDNPGKCGQACVQYNQVLKRYIMVGWFFTEKYMIDNEYSVLSVYESPTPWGKWTLVGLSDAYPYGWYDPSILGKFTSADGKTMKLVAASDGGQYHPVKGPNHYLYNILTMRLYTAEDAMPPSRKNSNLNLFKPVTASSVYRAVESPAVFAAERVNDGNKLTRTYYWQPRTSKDEWVCVDFGRQETVNTAMIYEFSSGTVPLAIEKHKIQYWDGVASAWIDAIGEGGPIGDCGIEVFPDIRTDKLRLLIGATKNDAPIRILEFQAFAMDKPVVSMQFPKNTVAKQQFTGVVTLCNPSERPEVFQMNVKEPRGWRINLPTKVELAPYGKLSLPVRCVSGSSTFEQIEVTATDSQGKSSTAKQEVFNLNLIPLAKLRAPVDIGKEDTWRGVGTLAKLDDLSHIRVGAPDPQFPDKPRWSGPEDLSCEIRGGWREDGLYLWIDVTDDHLHPGEKSKHPWEKDAIELFVDFVSGEKITGKRDKTEQIIVIPSIGGDFTQCEVACLNGGKFGDARFYGRKTERGYVVAGKLSYAQLSPGAHVGLDVLVDDCDDPSAKDTRKTVMAWHGNGQNHANSAIWGRFVLVE